MRVPYLMDSLQKVGLLFKDIPRWGLILGCSGMLITTGCMQGEAVYQPAVSRLLEKAHALKQAEQPEEALCRLKAAEDIAPNTFQVHYNMGTLLSETNQMQAAIVHLERALELKPEDPSTLYTLGYTYQTLGDDYNLALNPPQGVSIPKSNPLTAGLTQADITAKRGDAYQNAIKTYELFLETAPASDPGRKTVESQLNYLKTQ